MVNELLKKLSNAHGVSGSEGSVFSLIKKELKEYPYFQIINMKFVMNGVILNILTVGEMFNPRLMKL